MQLEKLETIKLENIVPYARNPRKNQDIDKVASSIKEYGFQQPLVLDKENIIIVGHTRYLAAKKLGMTEVPCIIADKLSPQQVKAYRIADNRVAEESKWDNELLNLELLDLQKDNINFDNLGFMRHANVKSGLEPRIFFDIKNKKSKTDIKKGQILKKKNL